MAGSCSKFFFYRHHSFSTGTGSWPAAAVNSFFSGSSELFSTATCINAGVERRFSIFFRPAHHSFPFFFSESPL
jgi:hypothetical protein